MSKKIFIATFVIFLIASQSFAASYEVDDWVFYRDFKQVWSADKGREFIYFATNGGIIRWDYFRSKWDTPMTVALIPGDALAFDTTYVVAYDENTGYLWCGTTDGLLSYSTMLDEWELHPLPLDDPPVLSIGITNDNIWVEGGQPGYGIRMLFKGSPTSGFFMVSSSSELYQAGAVDWQGERGYLPEEFPQYFVNQSGWVFRTDGWILDNNLYEYPVTCRVSDDGRGYSWLGFYGCGAGRVDNHTQRMDMFTAGVDCTQVKAILLEKKDMWLGGKGFTQWKRDNDKWYYYRPLNTTGFDAGAVYDIFRVKDELYLATDLGLTVFNLKSERFHTLTIFDDLWNSQITSLNGDKAQLWIGTVQGLNVMNLETREIDRIYEERIRKLHIYDVGSDGRFVWVGTEFGIYLHDRSVGDWTYVRGSSEMLDSPVKTIYAGEQEIWFGRDLGLDIFDKDTGGWSAYQSVLFENRTPLAILPGDSLVWIGTDGGLFKFDRKLNRWYGYWLQDGLPADTVNAIQQEGDYLWLGTNNGLCRFYWNDPYRLD